MRKKDEKVRERVKPIRTSGLGKRKTENKMIEDSEGVGKQKGVKVKIETQSDQVKLDGRKVCRIAPECSPEKFATDSKMVLV